MTAKRSERFELFVEYEASESFGLTRDQIFQMMTRPVPETLTSPSGEATLVDLSEPLTSREELIRYCEEQGRLEAARDDIGSQMAAIVYRHLASIMRGEQRIAVPQSK